ncbi:hypothetical protein BDN72DRAFT_881850 [Pluteus cervinus]|uniref:Uncharacterized protein n=1 Tax=Pluteus cervinus TaxID=181527 RepID=A0ACD3AEB1_9AGAR|nr:hypothetical protein BDN72DRAFT_881850 [Pluteus cervinus]
MHPRNILRSLLDFFSGTKYIFNRREVPRCASPVDMERQEADLGLSEWPKGMYSIIQGLRRTNQHPRVAKAFLKGDKWWTLADARKLVMIKVPVFHMSTTSLILLPIELQEEVFQYAASESTKTAGRLLQVSTWVRCLIEPLLYEVIVFVRNNGNDIPAFYPPHIENRSSDLPDFFAKYGGHRSSKPSKITYPISNSSLYPFKPAYRLLTHLDLVEAHKWENWSTFLTRLPNLTHLALDDIKRKIVSSALGERRMLQALLLVTEDPSMKDAWREDATDERYMEIDERLVVVQVRVLDNWLSGVRGRVDMWGLADQVIIERRKKRKENKDAT